MSYQMLQWKSCRVWNDMRVNKWWQIFFFYFLGEINPLSKQSCLIFLLFLALKSTAYWFYTEKINGKKSSRTKATKTSGCSQLCSSYGTRCKSSDWTGSVSCMSFPKNKCQGTRLNGYEQRKNKTNRENYGRGSICESWKLECVCVCVLMQLTWARVRESSAHVLGFS